MTETASLEKKIEAAPVSSPAVSAKPVLKQPATKEIKPLTTLRFLAAFAVVVSHASGSFTCWHGLDRCYLVGQAVTFFFVLSGFILTYNYFHLKDIKGAASFYLARLARIWPAHVCSLLLLILLIPEVFKIRSGDLPLFLGNLFLLQAWIPSWQVFFSYNASAWSISTEMFFYICFPFLLWGMNKRWYFPLSVSAFALVLLVCLANAMHLPEFDSVHLSNQGLLYINPLSSIFDFCAGMTAALFWRETLSKIKITRLAATFLELGMLAGVCLLNINSAALAYVASSCLGTSGAYWIQNSGLSIAGFALLILIFAMNKGWISRLFSHPALVLLGELSFGIYMLHSVLITFLGVNFPQENSTGACLVFLVALCVSAHLMFELVEKPMRRIMIKIGQTVINLVCGAVNKNSRQDQAIIKAAVPVQQKSRFFNRPTLLTIEAAAFALFIYFCLPTVQQISPSEASRLANQAAVKNILLPPYLQVKSASAVCTGSTVDLSLAWQALKQEPVNFSVRAIALDSSGASLGSITYTQDGRQTLIKAGTCWLEKREISIISGKTPSSVVVAVLRKKREILHASGLAASIFSFTVPVCLQTPRPEKSSYQRL